MRRLLHWLRTSIVYIGLIVTMATYPLTMSAHADTAPAPDSSTTPPTATTQTTATDPSSTTTSENNPTIPVTSSPSTTTISPTPSSTMPTSTSNTSVTTTTGAQTGLASTATTGNATVANNTTAGDATSGDASAAATVVNNVNSTVSTPSVAPATFVSNVVGDVQGDIVLQPMITQATSAANVQPATNATISSANATQLTNNVNLAATSGNASVTNNTSAGNATTGTAVTMANIVNVVNSMVVAGQSFIGTINIYGNLNGDILISPTFIPQLLSSNSTVQAVNSQDTQTILNNVSLTAQSGASLVQDNTKAGNAASGSAQTGIVIFNLTGHQIIATDSLLVFVNVLGTWVGVIVNAPAGSTAAAIGDGVTTNVTSPNLTVTSQNSTQIINNVALTSRTGDATVAGNTSAGNARTGNATALANIANISNSSIGLAGWFGILFINVFGSWFGSFGIDTSAGTRSDPPITTNSTPTQVIAFIPHQPAMTPPRITSSTDTTSGDPLPQATPSSAVLAATTTNMTSAQPIATQAPTSSFPYELVFAGVLIAALLLWVLFAATRSLRKG